MVNGSVKCVGVCVVVKRRRVRDTDLDGTVRGVRCVVDPGRKFVKPQPCIVRCKVRIKFMALALLIVA